MTDRLSVLDRFTVTDRQTVLDRFTVTSRLSVRIKMIFMKILLNMVTTLLNILMLITQLSRRRCHIIILKILQLLMQMKHVTFHLPVI